MYNLIFFAAFFAACKGNKETGIAIVTENGKALGITIPREMLNGLNADSLNQSIAVRIDSKGNNTNVLGDFVLDNGGDIGFKSFVPLSPGTNYVIFYKKNQIGAIEIPSPDPSGAPSVTVIYPTSDTLPENLLKVYIKFSRPMREGESQKYVSLVKNERDTLYNTFLDLQPELWNDDRTVLTMWLDPGRIKRDLQPNKRLGNPLKKGDRYQLVISDKWKSSAGLKLKQGYVKKFFTGSRDSVSPDPSKWVLKIPKGGTTDHFDASFGEALDYYLSQETIQIADKNGKRIPGKINIKPRESGFSFTPNDEWLPGNYRLIVQTRLEDLAGNNLNRPFDRDIKNSKAPGTKAIIERVFEIK